jgi:hypothetical protein
VRLGAGEILHRRAAALGRHEPEVGLLSAAQEHAGLRVATTEHTLDKAVGREPVHDGGGGADGEHVEVAARLTAPAEAPDRDEFHVPFLLSQRRHERGGGFRRVCHEVAAGMAPVVCERLEHRFLLARTHAPDLPDAAILQRGVEIVQGADPQLRMQLAHGSRTHALQPCQIEEGGRELGEELPVVLGPAGLRDLAHFLREVAADARDLQQLRFIEVRQALRGARHAVGGIAVGANLERVLPLDLEQVGYFPEQARDREVIHGSAPCS